MVFNTEELVKALDKQEDELIKAMMSGEMDEKFKDVDVSGSMFILGAEDEEGGPSEITSMPGLLRMLMGQQLDQIQQTKEAADEMIRKGTEHCAGIVALRTVCDGHEYSVNLCRSPELVNINEMGEVSDEQTDLSLPHNELSLVTKTPLEVSGESEDTVDEA